jgi:hypothetical protein
MKGQLLAALGIVLSAGSLIPASAGPTPPQGNGFSQSGLALSCSVIHATPALHITNTNLLGITLKKGQRIGWSGPQGQQGEFTLQSDLPQSKTIDVKINSDFASCKAFARSK